VDKSRTSIELIPVQDEEKKPRFEVANTRGRGLQPRAQPILVRTACRRCRGVPGTHNVFEILLDVKYTLSARCSHGRCF